MGQIHGEDEKIRSSRSTVDAGSASLLLGWSYLDLGFVVPTPSFFTLEREAPVGYVPAVR